MSEKNTEEIGYDRPGFLTKKDRQFLREQPEDGDYAEKRRRIRQRTQSAFKDFVLLFEQLPAKDLQLIFEDYDSRSSLDLFESSSPDLHDGVVSALAFICLGLGTQTPLAGNSRRGHSIRPFENATEEGMRKAYEELGYILHQVDFDISSMDRDGVDQLRERVERKLGTKEYVKPREVMILMQAGEISWDSVQETVQSEIGDDAE